MLYELLQVGNRNVSSAVAACVALEIDFQVAFTFVVKVADELCAFVANGETYGVNLVAGEHDVLGNTRNVDGKSHFLFVCLVEPHE